MPFVLPLGGRRGGTRRGPLAMRLGFALDALVALDRNRDVPPSLRIPSGQVLSRTRALERFPMLTVHDASAFACWYDYVTVDADRLTLSWAFLAASNAATLANYVQATSLILDQRRITGVAATDVLTGRSLEIAAHMTVNATGGSLDTLLEPARTATRTPMLLTLNLVTALPVGPMALGGYAPSGQTLFMVPWFGKALFGTWEIGRAGSIERGLVDEAHVTTLLAEVNAAFPGRTVTRGDVTLIHRGAVPAAQDRRGQLRLEGQQAVHDHGFGGNLLHGLLSVAGTKYTTARSTAEYVVDHVFQKLGRPLVRSKTAVTFLPGSHFGTRARSDPREYGPLERVTPDIRAHLIATYGSSHELVERLAGRPHMSEPLSRDPLVIAAQVVWAVRHEMAVTLVDVVRRRTLLGATAHPGPHIAGRVAQLIATEVGWTPERVRAELDSLTRAYDHAPPAAEPATGS
ncbi:MAG: hypothetical protein FJ207_14985 [Gemmatimonadetes bacterium]|nr:hypothetical protein [Gemmatimonadota bacterium]